MSYIAAMLIEMTNNEEMAFHIFNAILTCSSFGDLFINGFALMKKYFYVFERLLTVYLPEVSGVLKQNNVNPSYYISPWFITLFSNAYCHLPQGQSGKSLIYVLDIFVCKGWNGIMRVGLCLMKNYEMKLLTMKFEDLLPFVINELKMLDFFEDNNFAKFKEIFENTKIDKGIISNIENEYDIQLKIESEKENEKKIQYEKENLTLI